jgi:hypothetical protein
MSLHSSHTSHRSYSAPLPPDPTQPLADSLRRALPEQERQWFARLDQLLDSLTQAAEDPALTDAQFLDRIQDASRQISQNHTLIDIPAIPAPDAQPAQPAQPAQHAP